MKPLHNAGASGRDEFDGEGAVAAVADPVGLAAGASDSLDEDLTDADLGERDEFILVDDEEELDELIDPDDDDDDDDQEVVLLQQLGIDLDAADLPDVDLDMDLVSDDEEDSDDGVAA